MTRTFKTIALAVAAVSLAQVASAAELRMSWWGGNSRHKATQEALKVCGEKYGHTVKPEFTGWSGHLEKLTTQLAGGTEADIMQVNWPWLPLFSKKGDGFADLNQFKDIIDLSQWTDDQKAATSVNGKLNGLPLSTTGRVFMFNKTTYDKAGLAIPTTWDELFAAAPVFKAKLGDDYYPFEAYDNPESILIIALRVTQSTGKDLVDPAKMEVAWTVDELADSFTFYQKMVDAGVVRSWKSAASQGKIKLHENPMWADGRIGGSYEWDSTYYKYSDPLKEGQKLVPVKLLQVADAKTEGVYRKPSMMFSISKRSENQKAAAQIVNCLLTEKEGIMALGATRGLPASAVAAKMLKEKDMIKPTLFAANKIIMAGKGPNVSPFNEHPEVRQILMDTMEQFAYGQVTATEAAEQVIEGVNDVLADFR